MGGGTDSGARIVTGYACDELFRAAYAGDVEKGREILKSFGLIDEPILMPDGVWLELQDIDREALGRSATLLEFVVWRLQAPFLEMILKEFPELSQELSGVQTLFHKKVKSIEGYDPDLLDHYYALVVGQTQRLLFPV